MCLFDSQIAEILGIDVIKGIKQSVIGITGFPQDYYIHTINIIIGGWKHKIEVGFTELKQSYGILGQKGFFDIYIVKFDLVKEEIELKSRFL